MISYHVPVIEGMEFVVILLVALVVLGPQRLPEMARKVGNWTAEMRRAANELRQGLEAEVGDVREIARDIREPLREVKETVRETKQVIDEEVAPKTWVGPKPVSGPTPEDAMADLEKINAGESLDETPDDIPDSAVDDGGTAGDARHPLREVKEGGRRRRKVVSEENTSGAWVGPKQLSAPQARDGAADVNRADPTESIDEPPEDVPGSASEGASPAVDAADSAEDAPRAEGGAA